MDGRVARALQVDAEVAACRTQITRVRLYLTEHLADRILKASDTTLKLAVAGATDRVRHFFQDVLGLFDLARDAVGLKAIDPFQTFIAQRVDSEGGKVQSCRNHPDQDGRKQDPVAAKHQQASADPGENRSEDFARNSRAAGNLALVESVFGADAVTRQPSAKQQRGDTAKLCGQFSHGWEGKQRRAKGDDRQHEKHVDLRAMAHRLAALEARDFQPLGRDRLARVAAGALARGAMLSAVSLRHGSQHPEAAERSDQDDHTQRKKCDALQKAGTHTIPEGLRARFAVTIGAF